jgi:peptide/nickel transport system permease protein
MIAFSVIIISTLIGVLLGSLAGYFGKWVDQIIMRLIDVFICIPTLPLLLLLGAAMDMLEVESFMRIIYLMGILALTGWSGTARLVRGQILMLKEQDYMLAAEAMGLSVPRRIIRHLLPNVMPQLIVSMTMGLGGIILSEATLSFLGLGVQLPYAAWGTMIGRLESFNILQNHFHLWGPPGRILHTTMKMRLSWM